MTAADRSASPVIKFCGGKRDLLPEILPRMPAVIDTYFEPFVGGGAVFFALANEKRFKRAVISDTNAGLINMYTQVRDQPNRVIAQLRAHKAKNSEEYFYQQRAKQLTEEPSGAARFIYLNKTGYNGLFRVNLSGGLNTPYGHYENPKILDVSGIKAASVALRDVEIVCCGFEKALARAGVGVVYYLDPPYVQLPGAANFIGYGKPFKINDQEDLAKCMAAAVKQGANCLLSNSDCPESRRIYAGAGYQVDTVMAKRNINSKGDGRGAVPEILVTAPKRRSKAVK